MEIKACGCEGSVVCTTDGIEGSKDRRVLRIFVRLVIGV